MAKFGVAILANMCTSLFLLGLCPATSAKVTVYNVGDEEGWGPGNDYSLWVKAKTFLKHDILVFRYGDGYSVEEVREKKFKACDPSHPIFSGSNGNTSIPLKKAGFHYFIGGAFQECSQGMNLSINVLKRLHKFFPA